MMRTWLANAGSLMAEHGAAEYLKGLSVISHARQRATGGKPTKSGERAKAAEEVDKLLASFREGFEPQETR